MHAGKSSWQNHDDCCFDHRRARSHLLATSQPQHATDQKARMCLSCFLRDEPTALICQILLFLAAGAPFRCHRQNHHPSPRCTAPPRFRVRGPSFDALDRAHLKARRHSASSLSGTAAHRHAPGHEDARFCTNVWEGGNRTRDTSDKKRVSYHYASRSSARQSHRQQIYTHVSVATYMACELRVRQARRDAPEAQKKLR